MEESKFILLKKDIKVYYDKLRKEYGKKVEYNLHMTEQFSSNLTQTQIVRLVQYVKQLNKSQAMNIDKYLDNTIKTHNGYVYKSEDAFNNYPYKICYISEKRIDELIEKYKNKNIDLNDGEIISFDLGESRYTIIAHIKECFELQNDDIIKEKKIDRLVFEYLDWQSVDLLLNDLEDEIYNKIKSEV
ncbi:MAG: hypothetical protein PHO12_04860 [Bacteroidales bacterium]|nr:hypothetical protein [Bacteroidales bacterium]MDD4685142.1 hypothetical protein [Bacteroidales bacterium]